MNLNFSDPLYFSLLGKRCLPESGGLYLLLSERQPNGKFNVLYVGQANNIQRRFGEHLNSDDQRIIRNVKYFVFSSESNAITRDFKEQKLITMYNPPYNTQLKPLLPTPLSGSKLKTTLPVPSLLPKQSVNQPLVSHRVPSPPAPKNDDILARFINYRLDQEEKRKNENLSALIKFLAK